MAHLATLFEGVDKLASRKGRPVIVKAGPGKKLKTLYRTRVFQSDVELKTALAHPDRHLGPPPPELAAAGRMNARGISVFYGANSQAAALAEVRPPVGSQVAVARFTIIRPLRLLDLTAFTALVTNGSIFDPGYIRALEKAGFLRTLGQWLSRPVMPNDESLEYLATQAVADFLATEKKMDLDGFIFPAVQAAGKARNVVLFHKAAQVKSLEIPKETEIEVTLASQDEGGWSREYNVFEKTPTLTKSDSSPFSDKSNDSAFIRTLWSTPIYRTEPWLDDWYAPALQIDETKIEIHIIKAVKFKADRHFVRRY